jgi:hypothetical protein
VVKGSGAIGAEVEAIDRVAANAGLRATMPRVVYLAEYIATSPGVMPTAPFCDA